ncbi:invasion associated locus B family protein [Azospirillum halopraeferens]|uniref:invasion associated locus B family protein n=1 Tax=Azospirillum halopraeferens TaxID=34010 RepID=UPI0003F8A514|nr:invasion associated locus B family protein [Azospirillum halopraeferens]
MPQTRTVRGAAASATLALALAVLPNVASAAEPRFLGSFRDWNAFSFDESGQTVCYMSSQPQKKEPGNVRRGDIYALVTHRPAENTFDVVSIIVGYPFRKNSEASIAIDGKDFALFTDGETAWARDAATDRAIVDAMRAGRNMVVKGVSARGTNTTDTYSLMGVSDAYDALVKACNVKR